MFHRLAPFALCLLATPLLAQPADLTTPEGAAFIHNSLQDRMFAFKEEGDTDIIYFSNLLAWRCGVSGIFFGLNDELPVNQFPMEPCYRELRDPNTMKTVGEGTPFFIKVPKGSAQSIKVRIVYENGTTATVVAERAKNLVY